MKKINYLIPILFLFLIVSCNDLDYHIHTYEEKWSYDENFHYHMSNCGHTLKMKKALHAFDDGKILRLMSVNSSELIRYTCKTCSYYKDVELEFEVKVPNGQGTIDAPYEIDNVGHLIWFSDEVNNGNTSVCAILTNDIIINENIYSKEKKYIFTPIGNSNNRYMGTFDGNNHSIYGLYINDETSSNVGLFGSIYGGTIKSLHLKDSYICGKQFVGGIAGDNTGTIIDSTSSAEIVCILEGAGGIAGGNFGIIKNSINKGLVKGIASVIEESFEKLVNGTKEIVTYNKNIVCEAVGGIAGGNYGEIDNCSNITNIMGGSNLGGITGINNGKITNSFNTGEITCITNSSYAYTGGIAGYNTTLGNITNTYNTNNVTGLGHYIGGITGFSEANGVTGITNSYNTGDITGKMYVGGISGYNQIKISNCYNLGIISGTRNVGGISGYNKTKKGIISSSYSTGSIIDTGNMAIDFGPIVGCNNLGTIENSFYIMGSTFFNGYGIPKTLDQFNNGEVTYLLNNCNSLGIWKQTLTFDKTPNFSGSRVFFDEINNIYINIK